MNDERNGDNGERGLLGRIAQALSPEPRSREDVESLLRVAMENDVIDEDAFSIIEGAMQVSGMQARDIMVPRPQMAVIKAEQHPRGDPAADRQQQALALPGDRRESR
jgi:magnesium and cobalt transporter